MAVRIFDSHREIVNLPR